MALTNFWPRAWIAIWCFTGGLATLAKPTRADETYPKDDTHRRTPLVNAIEECQYSVVSLRGQKTVLDETKSVATDEAVRHVNGMGTGVVIDPRGYILTNYHVVQDVKQIQVTTADRQTTTATLVARDPVTDLAIIKVDSLANLRTIKLGTSSDLMLAETVAAVGNAYGYEHTVTTGIISHLKRTVQINDNQIYEDLIQTDAPINPGNSGGPLLNLDGEMIGINVAVRVGAQGIAFAIPINEGIEVAAGLLREARLTRNFTGLEVMTRYLNDRPFLYVREVTPDGPAALAGIRVGDQIESINGQPSSRSIDFERALVDAKPGESLQVQVRRSESEMIKLPIAAPQVNAIDQVAWDALGLKFVPASDSEMAGRHPNYQRGLRIISVRRGSPSENEGIKVGDVLVAMHGWKTESFENLAYILEQPELRQNKNFMFYILRDREPYFGQMRVSAESTPGLK